MSRRYSWPDGHWGWPIALTHKHGVRAGHFAFTGGQAALDQDGRVLHPDDLDQQVDCVAHYLLAILHDLEVEAADLVRLVVYFVGDGDDEARMLDLLHERLGPTVCPAVNTVPVTGITLPALAHPGLMTKIAATAVSRRDANGVEIAAPPRRFSWPDGHWDWTTTLPYKHGNRLDRNTGGHLIHLGGQVSLDSAARVIDPDDTVAQTRRALAYIETVLADLGASMDDVVKVTTFYRGDASAEALHDNLNIRSRAFTEPGPATSGIPVPCLVYEHMCIEIEVIAVLD